MPAHGVGVLPSRWSLRNDPAGTATGAEDGAPAPAPKHPQSRKNYAASAHAQPPFCVGQPLPALVQHHAFFATLQPATQLAKPASQSNGAEVVPAVTHPVATSQALPWCWQHHCFFGTLQPACQFSNPAAQLHGSAGGGAWVGLPSQML